MNVAGQGSRITGKTLDNGGGLFRSGSKVSQKSGLFAAAGFMDLLVPAGMEIDPPKGMTGEVPLFGIDTSPRKPDGSSTMIPVAIEEKALSVEEPGDTSMGNHIDGLIEEMDRNLIAGTDPSELLARLLNDDMKMPGGIAVSDTLDPSVVKDDDQRIPERVKTENKPGHKTGHKPDENVSGGTVHRGIGRAKGVAIREQGMTGAEFLKERGMPAATLTNPDTTGATLEMKSDDFEIDVLPSVHREVREIRKPEGAINGKDMSGEALTGKLIENLNSAASIPLSGQSMREMEDFRLKVERESVRAIHSSVARDEMPEQVSATSGPGESGSSMPESPWTLKDEFLELVGRSGVDEFRASRTESRETVNEIAAVSHQAEAVKSVANVKRVDSIQKAQIMDTARDGLIEQIGNVVSRNGVQEIKMFLSPPELGEMKIRVEVRGKKVRASILVESVAIKGAVDGGTGRLADAIMNEGFVLEKLDVSVNDTDKHSEWNMSDDDMSVGETALDKPVIVGRHAETVRNDSGGIDLLV
ncbi:MAG: flagellar hook-length control protein FliK [Bacteroidales bacterium]|nr:flagellar hook-length control protein FliK [Candidatus Latescibacterota bacterium]